MRATELLPEAAKRQMNSAR